MIEGVEQCGHLGHSLAAGDADGDGLADLWLGAPGRDEMCDGRCDEAMHHVWGLLGPPPTRFRVDGSDFDIVPDPMDMNGYVTYAIADWLDGGVDLDGDGRDEVLTGDGSGYAFLFSVP